MDEPVFFRSWDEYWAARNDPAVWLPFARRALREAELPTPESLTMQTPSQYPTARAGDAVVTIYPDAWGGRSSYDLELEAHSIVQHRDLPIPRLLAHGDFPYETGEPQWWLIESAATGVPWATLKDEPSPEMARNAASSLGAALRRLHDTPHDQGRLLATSWTRFRQLVEDELTDLGTNDNRLASFPAALRPALRELAETTYRALDDGASTRLLHGDVHADNVFVDPSSGELTAIIDLNEMSTGDPWYDLGDACFRLARGEPPLTEHLLRGYGFTTGECADAAECLLGWGLLHDFDGLTPVVQSRGVPTSNLRDLAGHLTGLNPVCGASTF